MATVKKSVKKAQLGDILKTISPLGGAVAGLFGKKKQAPMQPPAEGMMKKGGKMKKAQAGTSTPKKKAVDSVKSEMFPGKMIPKSKSNFENRNFDKTANALKPAAKKAKSGGSFPDLNKDGKITKADILKGRGVIAKKGMKVKKAQDGIMENMKEKSKMTTKDPSGNYKIKIKQESGDGKVTTTGKVRRTLKGFLSGAPRPDASKKNYSSETTYKKGGSIKKKMNMGGMMKKGGKMTKKCAYGCK